MDALIRAYVAGASVSQLGKRFRIHRTTVLAHLERKGIPRRAHQRKLTDDDVREAVRLYQEGWSTVHVGQHFAVNSETIRKELHRAGALIRPAR